jgi:hypothetical protein
MGTKLNEARILEPRSTIITFKRLVGIILRDYRSNTYNIVITIILLEIGGRIGGDISSIILSLLLAITRVFSIIVAFSIILGFIGEPYRAILSSIVIGILLF